MTEFEAGQIVDITVKGARIVEQHSLGFLQYEADGVPHEVLPGGSVVVEPAGKAGAATFDSLTADLDAAVAIVPDMDRDELIDLREALVAVTEAIEKEQGERDWVTRNEH